MNHLHTVVLRIIAHDELCLIRDQTNAAIFLRSPGKHAFRINRARRMGVQVAALGHSLQKLPQGGIVIERLVKGARCGSFV